MPSGTVNVKVVESWPHEMIVGSIRYSISSDEVVGDSWSVRNGVADIDPFDTVKDA